MLAGSGESRPRRQRTPGWLAALALLAPFQASGDEAAFAGVELAEGFELRLFAADPAVVNPVCLYVDTAGDVYVAETFRFGAVIMEVPGRIDEDRRNTTVAQRVAMMERTPQFGRYATASDRVRWLRDGDGDGRADVDTIFAADFTGYATGVGAGLLVHGGDLYYACVPTLWRLRDADGNRRADERTPLSTGYGVNVSYHGHGLHGLRIGPDGKLYFSIGDRGFNVETEAGALVHPHSGAVLRCDLDGSHLEVFATGLRNPQELAFDEHGDLFTADNNARVDEARVVHVIEGSDSGWRYGYEWLTEPDLCGPWLAEALWKTAHEGQAAYVLPPIGHLGVGPSGLTYAPGTGLPGELARHFFLCDYANDPNRSGVWTFALEPHGATHRLVSKEPFLRGILATDCDFAPDGTLYVSDWVDDNDQPGKGRVFRVFHPGAGARGTAALLAEGTSERGVAELVELLAHADQRVRQAAQFELVARGAEAELLGAAGAAEAGRGRLPRLHGIWGVAMLARAAGVDALAPLLDDADDEVRAQVAKVLRGGTGAFDGALLAALRDPAPRVRMFAALTLGHRGSRGAVGPLLDLLASSPGDTALRHAAVMGLVGCASPEDLVGARNGPLAVRLGAVVALRRLGAPAVAAYLHDPDGLVVLEAARAIYDAPIPSALPTLARLLERDEGLGYALGRRVLHAALRGPDAAAAVLRFASRSEQDERLRVEALNCLARANERLHVDPVTGAWRADAGPRLEDLPRALEERITGTSEGLQPIEESPPAVLTRWMRLLTAVPVSDARELVERTALDRRHRPSASAAALEALVALDAEPLATAERLMFDPRSKVRAAALDVLGRLAPDRALLHVERLAREGTVAERRVAYAQLGRLAPELAARVLEGELAKLDAGEVPGELGLDLVTAIESLADARLDARLEARLAERRAQWAEAPQLAPFLDGLTGGAPEAGRRLFGRPVLQCVRCHGLPDGANSHREASVGSDLRGLGERATRLEILESMVDPARRVAPGYATFKFELRDGSVVHGRVLDEVGGVIRLRDPDGELREVRRDDVVLERSSPSVMPSGFDQLLSREQMRDLIEYLAGL